MNILTPRFKEASDGDFQYCFEQLIDMFVSWETLGTIKLCQCYPESMYDGWGNEDPASDIWPLLLLEVCNYFQYVPTQLDISKAAASKRRLRTRSSKPRQMKPYKNAPRGSGNRYYYGYGQCKEQETCEEVEQSCTNIFEC